MERCDRSEAEKKRLWVLQSDRRDSSEVETRGSHM